MRTAISRVFRSKQQWALKCLSPACRTKYTGKNRYNLIRKRAFEQNIDYLRQLQPPRPSRQADIDPQLFNRVDDVRASFGDTAVTAQQDLDHQDWLPPAEALIQEQQYAGQLGRADIEPFGFMNVSHGDIFQAETDAVILPMTPNLMPYRGLSLEVFDRGGRALVQETFAKAAKTKERNKAGRAEGKGLVPGDTIIVDGIGMRSKHILFVIVPWFWQGSPMDAAKRFRWCVKAAFAEAASPNGFESVALPNLGCGVYGYEPQNSSRALMEEAIEALLQIEAEVPSYTLRRISFVDSRKSTAETLNGALTQVAHRWLPESRVTTAAQYWGKATQQLVVLPDKQHFFEKRYKVKFRMRHGVLRRMRKHYLGNVRPTLWRAQRVRQPPPFLVYEKTGEPAPQERQLPARPYFFRGVSHWLFPSRRTGFHGLRKSTSGNWVGLRRHYRMYEATRPRL